jgi:hypothetical protein
METLTSIGIFTVACIAGCFTGGIGFFGVVIVGTVYQLNVRRDKKNHELQNKIIEELKEIKYRNAK